MTLFPTQTRTSYKNQMLIKAEKEDHPIGIELIKKRVKGLRVLLKSRGGEMNRYEIQKATLWGDGTYERTTTKAIQEYADVIYDKEDHKLKLIKTNPFNISIMWDSSLKRTGN